MEAVRHSAVLRGGRIGDQSVSRRSSNSLAESIPDAAQQDHGPDGRQEVQTLGRYRRRVADPDQQSPSREPVRERAADQLEKRGRALGHPLDQADHRRRSQEHVGEEERNDVNEHLTRDVREETHKTQRHDVAGDASRQRPSPARAAGGGAFG